MRPVVFAGCFGWLHPAAAAARGVVLCGPHGEEEALSHRAWLHLAEQLASRGMPALRFDYRGCGDSIEDDEAPGRVAAWRGSVAAAVAFMRQEVGVAEVALVGLRLGALLAGLAAEGMQGVESLALIAPVAVGKDYARELRILSTRSHEHAEILTVEGRELKQARNPRATEMQSEVETLGFTYAAETLRELGELSLLDLRSPPARRTLILKQPGRVTAERLAAHLRGLGGSVETQDFGAYVGLMRGPPANEHPAADFAAVASWLAKDLPREAAPSRVPALPTGLAPPGMVETPAFFGDRGELFGILCRPAHRQADLPALVFLNTWWNHHIGSGRLSVTLSRHFAGLGYACLRFDVAGIGESPVGSSRPGPLPPLEDAVVDVAAALDFLERAGHRGAILIGMCWGGNLAGRVSLTDRRVTGQVLINTQHSLEVTADRQSHARPLGVYLRLALAPRTWGRLFGRDVDLAHIAAGLSQTALRRLRLHGQALRGRLSGTGRADRFEAGGRLERWTRSTDTLLVVSGDEPDRAELAALDRTGLYRRYPHVRLGIIEGADHVFSRRAARGELIALIEDHLTWLGRSFTAGSPDAAAPDAAAPDTAAPDTAAWDRPLPEAASSPG